MSITAGSTARGLPYPGHASAADVPTNLKALADAIETMMNSALVLGSTLSTTKLTISGATGQVEARAQNATGNVVFAAKRTADTTDLLQILANGTVKVSGGSGSLASAMVPGTTGVVDFPNGLSQKGIGVSPYFRAYRSSSGSYADGETVIFNTETDPNGWYSTSTGIFLPTVAGTYRVSWTVTVPSAPTGTATLVAWLIDQGGSTVGVSSSVSAGEFVAVGTQLRPFNGTTDSAHVKVLHSVGGNVAVEATGLTHFDAEYVGA